MTVLTTLLGKAWMAFIFSTLLALSSSAEEIPELADKMNMVHNTHMSNQCMSQMHFGEDDDKEVKSE